MGASASPGFGIGGRRMIKAAIVLITLGYCSLLVYQEGVSFNFQERPLHVTNLSTESVTKTKHDSGLNKNITLDDIFISVKTTIHYQDTRLPIILKTWFQLAKNQTWFFTDTDNELHQNQTNGHMVNTHCPASHRSPHLCCKMAVEYDYFMKSGKKWFCHFDDDNYVNVPQLVKVLQKYDHQDDWYLGRTVNNPVEMGSRYLHLSWSFWFATGGAGFCISRSLALKMLPHVSGGRLKKICKKGRGLSDDLSIGLIIEFTLKKNMTRVSEFHSHLAQMKLLPPETFREQISFSYSITKNEWNVVNVSGYDIKYDPTRFLSLHCFLFPQFKNCLVKDSEVV